MTTGDLVIVATEDGKPGEVVYVCADGMIGAKLLGEHGRVDEWMPSQVRPTTVSEAVRESRTFLRV